MIPRGGARSTMASRSCGLVSVGDWAGEEEGVPRVEDLHPHIPPPSLQARVIPYPCGIFRPLPRPNSSTYTSTRVSTPRHGTPQRKRTDR